MYGMEYFTYLLIFLFGSVLGSFLNVVIYRYHTGVSPLSGRSFCFSCGHTLNGYDLLPIASFLMQRGRCRYCKSRISRQYIIVEILTGCVTLAAVVRTMALHVPPTLTDIMAFAGVMAIASILIVIAVYDVRHKIIPDAFVYAFAALAFLTAVGLPYSIEFDAVRLAAGHLVALPFAALWYVSEGRWIGFGDAKLALGMGWFLGLSGGYAAVMLAFWIGALFGIALIAAGRITRLFPIVKGYTMKSEVPFGPFLVIATFAVFFYGISLADIQNWFMFVR